MTVLCVLTTEGTPATDTRGREAPGERLVERGGLAHACGREQSLACGMGTPEPSDSTPGSALDCPRSLFRLCELALLDREPRATERRIKAATFPVLKSLETFEFRAIPSLNKSLVLELARSAYLDRRENVLALGHSGTGKTHLALALGLVLRPRVFLDT